MRTKMQKYAKNAKICENCKTHINVLKPLEISFCLGLRLRLGLMHCQEEFGGWKTLWDFAMSILSIFAFFRIFFYFGITWSQIISYQFQLVFWHH
jgi:hypothetical protein